MWRPASEFSNVLFADPEGPITAMYSPELTSKVSTGPTSTLNCVPSTFSSAVGVWRRIGLVRVESAFRLIPTIH